ncbi:MAG: energy-coupling factor ABC transporter ATP-binding protein [Deltaproteobacteria bacterium]|nr:energy-coupling factor ABC transporter ATP-binding protein [Deltaproteobacteria bacterium]
MQQAEKLVEVDCITHVYPDMTKVQICGLDFVVNRGERVSILGSNGCGKTTLLKHLMGILIPRDGSVRVFGVDPGKEYSNIRQKIGVVMQDVDEQILGPTVYDDILFAPLNYGMNRAEAGRLAESVIERLNLGSIKDKIVNYLSGGEKKKVALAGALVTEPELLILDEPFTGLDPVFRREFIGVLNELNKERGITFIMTLHEVDLVPEVADVLYLMHGRGDLGERGTPEEIFGKFENLAQFNLEEPTLTRLFKGLKKEGLDFGDPLRVDEAIGAIKKHWNTTSQSPNRDIIDREMGKWGDGEKFK